uniref:dihydrofolate reductase family protein n=1 Tax=Cecembia rubra TaxID=1485585 RepID=UPI0027151042
AELLSQGDAILYGKTTYHLMEYWRTFLENPSPEKTINDFAKAIDKIQKIVFSNTIKRVDWKSAVLAKQALKIEILKLRNQSGKYIFVGSRSLIIQLLKLNLIDEFQLCIYPIVEGKGLSLFEEVNERFIFKLVKIKTFQSGAVILYYQPKYE